MRTLIVEDEMKVANALKEGLEREDFEVVVAPTGEDAFLHISGHQFDVIVLDLMLPGCDGLHVLTTLRNRGLKTPTILLTARDSVEDRVNGFNAGADDYLAKPYAFEELLARIRALLRRGATTEMQILGAGDLNMNLLTRKVTRGNIVIDLTAREFDLLELLLRHQSHIVVREKLAMDIWKMPTRSAPLDNVIDVHMSRLRKKVDHAHCARLIHTVRGLGFILQDGEP